MRRSVWLLVLGLVLTALVLAGSRSVRAASGKPSPFPGGLSPQWLNAANVEPNAKGCGVPHGVLVTRGPTGITYSPPLWVDCSFATLLEPIESIIQE